MPKSPHKVTKWVWMSPLVLAPQTKNVPNRIQKLGTRATSLSTTIGVSNKALKLESRFAVDGSGSSEPKGNWPTSEGALRINAITATIVTANAAQTINIVILHPKLPATAKTEADLWPDSRRARP